MKKLTTEDPETKSADIVTENIEQLRELFPEAFKEGKINFDVLKQLLGGQIDEKEEKYGLNWHGKRRARQLALTPSTGTLRPCLGESIDWNSTQNLMIEGDNLEVLKLLQKSYSGKVKLIYIDPPYNTGNDFIYPDDFKNSIRSYLELTGQVDAGRKMTSNSEASGRFHTDWLNMMYPRLRLARHLLRDDGVIFISIDDHECDNLRMLCNEIFGEENFRANVVWRRTVSGAVSGQGFVVAHDHIMVYSKQPATELGRLPVTDEKDYKNSDNDPRGPYKLQKLERTLEGDRPSMTFEIDTPKGPITKTWAVSPQTFQRLLQDNRIVFSRTGLPYYKQFLSEYKGRIPDTWWDELGGFNQSASRELKDLFGEKDVFTNPKPVDLLSTIISIGCDSDGIVLDFFAGSGTTGHAVMRQSAVDGGKRRFILVQLPELLLEDDGERVAVNFCERLGKPHVISELTKERLRRVAVKIRSDFPLFAGDLGFRVFKLDSSCIQEWEPNRDNFPETLEESVVHLRSDRTESDILFELLLKLGLDLAVPIEEKTIVGKTVHSIGGGTLFVCLSESVNSAEVEPLALGIVEWYEELDPAGETTVVFRDSAFADDVAKTNLTAILDQHGLQNIRSL